MRPTSLLMTSTLLTLLIACGGGGDEPAARGAEDGGNSATASTSTAAASATGNSADQEAPGAASTDADDYCAEALFDSTATFALHEELPFQFEYPAGWDHLDKSGETQIIGSLAYVGRNGRRSHVGVFQYNVMRKPTDSPDVMHQIFARSMASLGTVTLGGSEVEVFEHRDRAAVTAKFLYPDDDGWHLANVIFGAASEKCVPERRRVRELFMESIADRS